MKKWLCLLALAGCSTAQWDKPGATTASVDADLRACTTAAQAVPSVAPPRTTSNAIEVRSSSTGVGVQTGVSPAGAYGDTDQRLLQSERVQDCMQKKGYTLKAS
jgi:hypothetical protein